MTILEYIKTDKCPKCDCDVVVNELIDTNYHWIDPATIKYSRRGYKTEARVFLCGYTASFNGDEGKLVDTGQCRKCSEYKEKIEKEHEDARLLAQFIEDNKISSSIVNRMYR